MIEKEGKLGQILSLLPESDWEELEIFLQSPYFNRSKPVRELFETYRTAWVGKQSMPHEEALHQRIFPEHDFDPIRVKNLRAALQRKLDQFLAQSAFDKDIILQGRLHLNKLNVLGETKHFARYLERARQDAAEFARDHAHLELTMFKLEEEHEAALGHSPDRSKQVLESSEPYDHAWRFFQLLTLKELISKANRKAILGKGELPAEALAILPLIKDNDTQVPIIRLHRLLLELYLDSKPKALLDHYISLLFEYSDKLIPMDALFLFSGALNHCVRWLNKGELEYSEKLLRLYKEMDRLELFFLDQGISAQGLKNMATLGIRHRDFVWVDHLIDRYSHRLQDQSHDNTEAFIRGMLHFSKDEYEQAERCFHRILDNFEDVFYGLDARSFLLRIYYETGNVVGLESLTESFKVYVRRNKAIAPAHKATYYLAAKLFKQLVQIQPWDKPKLLKFRQTVSESAISASTQQWLLDKLDKLVANA